MRVATLLLLGLTACGPVPERADLHGLWGRIDDGNYDIFEFAEQIDATGLTELRPAYRRYRYPVDAGPTAVENGRWIVIDHELILIAGWSLGDTPTGQNRVYEIAEFEPRQLLLVPPGAEQGLIYTTLERLPERQID